MNEEILKLKEEFEKLNENSSVRELQEYTKKMINTRGFSGQTPKDIMLLLTEELGELAKEVRKSTNLKIDSNSNREQNIDKEIADVFIYIMSLCVATDIDLFEAYKSKEKINFNRTWK